MDIPEDVMRAAKAAAYAVEGGPYAEAANTSSVGVDVVARAILAERERCANVLAAYPPDQFFRDLYKRASPTDENGYILALEGDTGGWAAHMLVLLSSYSAAICGASEALSPSLKEQEEGN